jgi:phage tail-like protein
MLRLFALTVLALAPITGAPPARMISPTRAARFDPYKTFKFRIKWGGRYVAAVASLSALHCADANAAAGTSGDAASVSKPRGRSEFEAVTLERGTITDPTFEQWVSGSNGTGATDAGSRRDLVVEATDGAKVTAAYSLTGAAVSGYSPAPGLAAGASGRAIGRLTLTFGRCRRLPL